MPVRRDGDQTRSGLVSRDGESGTKKKKRKMIPEKGELTNKAIGPKNKHLQKKKGQKK